jgi:hypothetical protein
LFALPGFAVAGIPDRERRRIIFRPVVPGIALTATRNDRSPRAGRDPVECFDRRPKRFALVHVKDMDHRGEIADVGSGTIDVARIFARSETVGIRHYLVEHGNSRSPIESIAASYRFLRRLGF